MFGDIGKAFKKTFGLDKSMGEVVDSTKRLASSIGTGYSKDEFNSFMSKKRNMASQARFLNVEESAPKQISAKKNTLATQNGSLVSSDQMEKMMKAFRQRQQEVFGRRAAPGVAQQTRFM